MKKLNYMMINFILIFALLLCITISGLSADKVINWRLQSMCAAGDFGFEGAKMFAEQILDFKEKCSGKSRTYKLVNIKMGKDLMFL